MTILDHLWQSSLVAILAYVLTLAFRNNSASVRYWLWFSASIKFLLPFAVLTALGRMFFVHPVPAMPIAVLAQIRPVAAPFSAVAPGPAAVPDNLVWLAAIPTVWLLGFVSIVAVWLVRWRRLSAAARSAKVLAFDLPIPVKSTPLLLEPGLIGVRRPIILLPDDIVNRLSPTEIDAILSHELCHLRRQDNLLAMIHMLVESIFWFNPLVWFIGARLVEERERACDEGVLAGGRNPLEYARAILKVCRLYFRTPLACASGVSGLELERRINAIIAREEILEIGPGRKLLLAALLTVTIMTPFVVGGLKLVPAAQMARSIARVLFLPAPPAPVSGTLPVDEAAPQRKLYAAPRATQLPAANGPQIVPPEVHLVAAPEIDSHPDIAAPVAPAIPVSASAESPAAKELRPVAPYGPGLAQNYRDSTYCHRFANQTVGQGVDQPMTLDEAFRQRHVFFYLRCMVESGQLTLPWTSRPMSFSVNGAVSSERPVNVSGTWSISIGSWQALQRCNFAQAGNSIKGSCTGPKGEGPAEGTVDGRQVRWAWKYEDYDGLVPGIFKFIGKLDGETGTITGRSVLGNKIDTFTATPLNQTASRH